MKTIALIAAAAMCACGPNFAGTYAGTLTNITSCSDGSGGTSSGAATWSILDSNAQLTITAGGTCDPFSAAAQGNVATMQPKACPTQTTNSGTINGQLTSGTLTLSGTSLDVQEALALTISGAGSGTCNSSISGTLTLKPN